MDCRGLKLPGTKYMSCPYNCLHSTKIVFYVAITLFQDNKLLEENEQYNFTNNHQELNIRYMSQSDSGMYSCHASNRLGFKEARQEVLVKNGRCKQNLQ